MNPSWDQLEGVSLAGRYFLKRCLCSTANDAWYLTRFGSVDAAVRLMRADVPSARSHLELWQETLKFDHPHILSNFDSACTEVEGIKMIYVVGEYPETFLADAVAVGALSNSESREVLSACLSALTFLHGKGLIHGVVDSAHIVSVGGQIKLTSDTIRRAATAEPDRGGQSDSQADASRFAADLWSLGATLVEILTQERPSPGRPIPDISEPFATIVNHTCRCEPEERWSVEAIMAHLDAPAVTEAPVAAPPADLQPAMALEETPAIMPPPPSPAPRPVVESPIPLKRGLPLKWVPAVGLLAALPLMLVFRRHQEPSAVRPAVQTHSAAVESPAPVPAPAQLPPQAAPPDPQPARPNPFGAWRVVAYEYATRSAAENEARRLNARHPAWHAEVFAPRGNRRPYFVSLGGRMTLPEAERLRMDARAKGLPRDTFIRNFSE